MAEIKNTRKIGLQKCMFCRLEMEIFIGLVVAIRKIGMIETWHF